MPDSSFPHGSGPVVVVAGRRVDRSPSGPRRFPPENAFIVKERIAAFLRRMNAAAVVGAAAAGADILTLEAAVEIGLPIHVVLPFDKARFRQTSVEDCGADWAARYDRLMESVGEARLVQLSYDPGDGRTYLEGNRDILNAAEETAGRLRTKAEALVVWDGKSRGPDDVTAHFKEQAAVRGMDVTEIDTLS